MESAKKSLGQLLYIDTEVKRVWEQIDKVYVSGYGENVVFKNQSRGWFVAFMGSYEALYWGDEQPKLKVGDRVRIRFERIECPNSALNASSESTELSKSPTQSSNSNLEEPPLQQ